MDAVVAVVAFAADDASVVQDDSGQESRCCCMLVVDLPDADTVVVADAVDDDTHRTEGKTWVHQEHQEGQHHQY